MRKFTDQRPFWKRYNELLAMVPPPQPKAFVIDGRVSSGYASQHLSKAGRALAKLRKMKKLGKK